MPLRLPRRYVTDTVGRQAERSLLADRFAQAVDGQASVVLLIGDAGIGKTRLLEEAAVEAAHSGALVLRGRGSEIEGMPPYLLFLEALSPYIRSAPSTVLRRQLGSGAAVLGELFRELAARRFNLRVGTLPPAEARLRLFESIGQFLNAIAAEQPLLLLFDDLHWADSASLDLLSHVGCHQTLGRALIAGACRSGEADANPALNRVIDQLNRDRLLTVLQLSRLSAEDVTSLAANLLDGPISGSLGQSLYDHSEGNPFFAEELLKCWRENSGIVARDGSWGLASEFAPCRIPAGIAGTVRQRLARLPATVVRCLEIASVIGRAFEPEVIAAVAGRPIEAVEGYLMTACRSGLVRSDGDGTFSFNHDKIRECLHTEIPRSRHRRWHRAIGGAIEARSNHVNGHDLAALAFHFARSDDREKGVIYSLEAANNALCSYAAVAAIAHYRTALRLIDRNDVREAEILLRLGKALAMADDLGQARETCERAYAVALRAGNQKIAARAVLGLAQADIGLRRWRTARALLQESIGLFSDASDPEIVHVLSQLAGAEAMLGEHAAGVAHARQAQQEAANRCDPLLEAKACRSLGKLMTRMQETVAEGAEVVARALALATVADDPSEMAACLFRIAYAALNAGQLKKCLDASFARIDLARRAHDPFQLYHAQAWLAYMAALAGDWPEVTRLVAELQSPTERLTSPEPLSFLLKARGYSAYQRGNFVAAENAFAAVEKILGDGQEGLTVYRGLLGLAQLSASKVDAAHASIVDSERLLAAMPSGSVAAGPILVCLAAMALRLNDQPRLCRYYESLLPLSGQYYWFLIDRVLAAIEIRLCDWSAAEGHLAAAEAHASREGMRPEQALLLYARAELELARGGRGSAICARQVLAEALRGFEALGMAAEMDRARERLRLLPPQPGRPLRERLPAGLSGREAQVLGLVAAGLSNRQIARELALSDHTVANHLTTIFNKTGANNRAAAAVFAVRHGLVAEA
jgi:DNA-binding CsgD family transcriptional regulator/tetratricopeptide (TPR) repeat protein